MFFWRKIKKLNEATGYQGFRSCFVEDQQNNSSRFDLPKRALSGIFCLPESILLKTWVPFSHSDITTNWNGRFPSLAKEIHPKIMSTCAAWVSLHSLNPPETKAFWKIKVSGPEFGHTSSFHFSQWFSGRFGRVSSLHSYHQFPFKPSLGPARSVKPSSGNSSSCCDAGQGANPCYYDGSNVWTHRWKRWEIQW